MDIHNISKKCLLIILDGLGENPTSKKNAILSAKTPTLDNLRANYPLAFIQPGGEAVGLPKGISGNSEVGHMNLGAGRPVRQDLVRINEAIEKDSLKELRPFKDLLNFSSENKKPIHLLTLLSDGGVHSHIDHLFYIVNKIKEQNESQLIYVHAFMDGRDTAKNVGAKYLNQLKEKNITLASMQGRSIGMDRDRRWKKIKHCYDTLIGSGDVTELLPSKYLSAEYEKGNFDEFITPVLFNKEFAFKNDDPVFFLNFRPDRAIQISTAFNDPNFKEFDVPEKPGYFLCMTPYIAEELELPILFDKEKIKLPLSEYISNLGLKQLKIAETEKYAHVTYFFNGGEKKPFKGESHVLIPSPTHCNTYDEAPEMSALEVTERLISEVKENSFDFITVNYANCDMIGHTGNFEAAVKAVETIDKCLEKLIREVSSDELSIIITADHGNCDQMEYDDGLPHTSHSSAAVPFLLVHPKLKGKTTNNQDIEPKFALKDVAPTVLKLLGLDKPSEFSGESIF
jgi:2,3-bisphosphoglycerate-independent phosphoglycerate mutase